MQYEITYDLVGLAILVLLYILNFSTTKVPSKIITMYRAFIVSSFASAFFDVFTIWTNHYTSTPLTLALNNVLAVIHILCVGMVPLAYYLFVLLLVYDQEKIPKSRYAFIAIIWAYDFITICTSPFTKFIMYYDEAGTYLHGPGFLGTYIILVIFMLAGVIDLTVHFKKISLKQYLLVLSYTVIDVIFAVYQFQNPDVLLIGFASAVSLMVISYALKNPMEFIDNNLATLNRLAFKEFLYSGVKKGVMVVTNIFNAESIKYVYGLDNGYSILRKCINKLLKEWHLKNIYYVFKNTFILICRDEEDARKKIEILNKHKTTPVNVSLNSKTQDLGVIIESESFIIKNPDAIIEGLDSIGSGNKVEQFVDLLQFYVDKNREGAEIREIGEGCIDYYKEKLRVQKIVDDALLHEKFEVFLQPIFDVKLQKFTGAESLIRLRDSEGKMISPALFIPEAEKNGRILELGDISIKKTCEFIRDGKLMELGIEKVNINLSMIQCMQDNIVEHLIELLDRYNIPKSMIRFEITETITTTNPEKLKNVMMQLSEYGIEFALDDYGTGYSNTSRLLDFPFSEIKFDKSFVDSAIENTRNALPLKHLMNMVSDSNMIVLVEGVETKEMSDLIKKFGGNLIQGFYYAKPLPMNEFVEFIKEKN